MEWLLPAKQNVENELDHFMQNGVAGFVGTWDIQKPAFEIRIFFDLVFYIAIQ
jgi:hypothetical protein